MYTCSRCDVSHEGPPPLINACGTFCQPCKEYMLARSRAGKSAFLMATAGTCRWCGKAITPTNPGVKGPNNAGLHQHATCDTKRDWMLDCIRNSPHLANYVAKTEAREKPLRALRAVQAERLAAATPEQLTPQSLHELAAQVAALTALIHKHATKES